MSTLPFDTGFKLGGGLLDKSKPREKIGLLNFLSSPQGLALAAGLLEESAPSFDRVPSFGTGLARGFGNMQKINQFETEQQLEKDKLEQQKLLEQARLEILKGHLDVDRGKLDLEKFNKAQSLEQRLRQQELLNSLLSAQGAPSAAGGANDNRSQRAAILAAAGYTEEAFKVLTEKPTVNPADVPTRAVLTQNQQVSQAVDNVVPQIKALMKEDVPVQSPDIFGLRKTTSLLSPEKQARYEAKVASITDTLVAALALPRTNESINLVGKMVRKQFGESDEAYHKRLEDLTRDLEERKKSALNVTGAVGSKIESNQQIMPEESSDELVNSILNNAWQSKYSAEDVDATYSAEDVDATAKKYGITPDEVIRQLEEAQRKK